MFTFSHDKRADSKLTPEQLASITSLEAAYTTADASGYTCRDADRLYLVSQDDIVQGKIEYFVDDEYNTAHVRWLCAVGYGDILLESFETQMRAASICAIELRCVMDSREATSTVLRRVNFWIKHRYQIDNILYGEGRTTLCMFKRLLE